MLIEKTGSLPLFQKIAQAPEPLPDVVPLQGERCVL